jgi:hypothetical protein
MKTPRRWLMTAGLGTALLATGCATARIQHAYSGEQRPPAELATVLGKSSEGLRAFGPGRERITFLSVDDRDTVPWYSIASPPGGVYVPAGRHKLGVRYEFVHGAAAGPVWVDARSNHTYQVKVLNPGDRTERIYFVVEDITAQTLVGGSEKQAGPATNP